jgi:hypothetical protein
MVLATQIMKHFGASPTNDALPLKKPPTIQSARPVGLTQPPGFQDIAVQALLQSPYEDRSAL